MIEQHKWQSLSYCLTHCVRVKCYPILQTTSNRAIKNLWGRTIFDNIIENEGNWNKNQYCRELFVIVENHNYNSYIQHNITKGKICQLKFIFESLKNMLTNIFLVHLKSIQKYNFFVWIIRVVKLTPCATKDDDDDASTMILSRWDQIYWLLTYMCCWSFRYSISSL
jgi:hypothetical protein